MKRVSVGELNLSCKEKLARMTLFRQEAIQEQRQSLHGDVFLPMPMSFKVIPFLLIALLSLILIILFTGTYSKVERVQGYLVPTSGLVKIQTERFGIITALHVKEGDYVQKGDPLVTVDATQATVDGSSVEFRSLQSLGSQYQTIKSLIVLEENKLESETGRLEAELTGLEQNISSFSNRLAYQKEITKLAKASYLDVQDIAKKGLITKSEMAGRQRSWLTEQAAQQLLEQEQLHAMARYKQLEIEFNQLPDEVAGRIARLKEELLNIDMRKAELHGKQSYLVKAPVAGRVTSITSNTIGQNLLPQQPLLSIRPEGSHLVAELFVPSSAIGFIEKGQEARLLYAAFPYQRFGSYTARITDITETILTPDEVDAPFAIDQPVYRVRAALETEKLEIAGKSIALQPGMQLDANIIREKRSFLGVILEPIRALRGRT